MKNILMIATGGTIASGATQTGLAPQLDADELLHYTPQVKKLCRVDAVELFSIDSTNISPRHWQLLVDCIRENYERYDGFVITHGTDTMAYTAAALSYYIQHSPKPIVLTGAQKPISMEITDSKTNLEDAFSYACADASSGVVIVFGGKVILGTRARKVRTKSFDAFASINYPPLAEIVDGRMMRYIALPKEQAPAFYERMDAKIGIFKLIPGMGADVLEFILERYDAVIIESYGVGGIPSLEGAAFDRVIERGLSAGKIVVMTTQVPNEGSDMTVYRVGRRLKSRFQLIEAFDMTSESVNAKLLWLCSNFSGAEASQLRRLFYTSVANDMLYSEYGEYNEKA